MERAKRIFPSDDTLKPLIRQDFSESRFQKAAPIISLQGPTRTCKLFFYTQHHKKAKEDHENDSYQQARGLEQGQ